MYGSNLYGSSLYGSSGGYFLPFNIGKSRADLYGLAFDQMVYVDLTKSYAVYSADPLDFASVYIVNKGFSQCNGIEVSIDAVGTAPFDPALSQAIFSAEPMSYQGFLDVKASQGEFRSDKYTWNQLFDGGISRSSAMGFPYLLGISSQVAKAVNEYKVNGLRFFNIVDIAPSHSSYNAIEGSWLLLFDAISSDCISSGSVIAYTVSGLAQFDLYASHSLFKAMEIDADYVPVTSIPNLVATRSAAGNTVSIDVLNPINASLSITRADDYLGTQEDIAVVPVSSLPYVDSVNINDNYRYIGTYSVTGEKGGLPRVVRGPFSSPRLTFGKNRTL